MQKQQMSSTGLTRYRSAPSSYFTEFLNNNSVVGGTTFGSSNDIHQQTQKILSKFMTGSETIQQQNSYPKISLLPKPSKPMPSSQHLPPRIKKPNQKLHRHRSNDYSSVLFQRSSTKLERVDSVDLTSRLSGGGGSGGLIRHNSSPAGIFANMDIEKEFGADKNLKTQMMSPISEVGSERTGDSESTRKFGASHGNDNNYLSDFAMDSWDDSSKMFDEFLKELVDEKPFPSAKSSDNHVLDNEDENKPTTRLAHHLSLPTSSAELSAIEKLLHDSVPLKLRAKRGRATHPRSIAERVRRTKISDRMRKLQEVVPNMEKQTNTSDMLDFAADYIKELQRQERKLSDARAKCSCPARVKF